MNDLSSFTKLVPGFDFLQGLAKNAGAAMPGIGQWVAPTLDPAELEKRIQELRTVQFWLEQNARLLATTIQALEVQRMTLSTLKTMNVQMGDLRETLKIKPLGQAAPAPADAPAVTSAQAPPRTDPTPKPAEAAAKKAAPKPGNAIDPMQWWGALTNQFAQLATSAMKESAADTAKAMAGGLMKQSFEAAAATMQKVAGSPATTGMTGKAGKAGKAGSARTVAKQRRAGSSAG